MPLVYILSVMAALGRCLSNFEPQVCVCQERDPFRTSLGFYSLLGGSFSAHTFLPLMLYFVPIETYVTSRVSPPPYWTFLKPSLVEIRSLESGVPNSMSCSQQTWTEESYFPTHWSVLRESLVFERYRQRLESVLNCLRSYFQFFKYPTQCPESFVLCRVMCTIPGSNYIMPLVSFTDL